MAIHRPVEAAAPPGGLADQRLQGQDNVNASNTMNQLTTTADAAWAAHEAGNHDGCQKAWSLHLTLMDLGKGYLTEEQMALATTRMHHLTGCLD